MRVRKSSKSSDPSRRSSGELEKRIRASVAALVPGYRALFRRRRDHAAKHLATLAGIACEPAEAGFYLFPGIAGDDVATAKLWLDEGDVAVLPGSAFGPAGAGHLRLSLTPDDADIAEALARMARLGIVAGENPPAAEGARS